MNKPCSKTKTKTSCHHVNSFSLYGCLKDKKLEILLLPATLPMIDLLGCYRLSTTRAFSRTTKEMPFSGGRRMRRGCVSGVIACNNIFISNSFLTCPPQTATDSSLAFCFKFLLFVKSEISDNQWSRDRLLKLEIHLAWDKSNEKLGKTVAVTGPAKQYIV